MQDEYFARSLYGRWDSFYASCVERVADELLSKLEIRNEESKIGLGQIEIDKLELDLGSIYEDELDEQFPIRFREKLEEAVMQLIVKNEESKIGPGQLIIKKSSLVLANSSFAKIDKVNRERDTLHSYSIPTSSFFIFHFLLHGTLPWSASGENRDIHQLFLKVLQEDAQAFKQFLLRYGHYTSLQQRLVYQLNDPELEKGIHLLTPEASGFIVGYIHLLRTKYKATRQPETTESNYRNTVWLVVYAYLLTHRSSYFDKKSFLTQTILQLAAKYNMSYDSLLTLLTSELESFCKKRSIPLELFHILGSLQKELSEKRLKESSIDAARFYKTVYASLQKELGKQISESSREGLIRILANPSSCRLFLQQLNETEIIRLVPVVIPHDSTFVIEVAGLIENGKGKMKAENKFSAFNSQFSIVKWQLIFPLLLEKRGTRFNRKQFVRTLLQQIAAHYNLQAHVLTDYFVQASGLFAHTDKELKSIFAELHKEYWSDPGLQIQDDNILNASSVTSKNGKPGELLHSDSGLQIRNNKQHDEKQIPDYKSGITTENTLQLLLQNLVSHQPSHSLPIEKIIKCLSDYHFRKKLVDRTSETMRYRLVQLIYPKEQQFIVSYAKSLDKLNENSSLQGKAGSGFMDIKWLFLFTVLSQMPAGHFNRRYFVSRVLQQIAAHYNLSYFDLLLYFRQEKISIYLPYQLEQLVDKLYNEEKEHWLKLILKDNQKADKKQYLDCFPGIDTPFIQTYLQALAELRSKNEEVENESKGVTLNFSFLISTCVFSVLLESQPIAFNKKQFVLRTLTKMAAHHHLSLYDLLARFNEILSAVSSLFQEVATIIRDLCREQQVHHQSHVYIGATGHSDTTELIKKRLIRDYEIQTTEEKKLLEQLISQSRFISYADPCLKLVAELRKFIRKEFNRIIDNKLFLELMCQLSAGYETLSRMDIFDRIRKQLEYQLSLSPPQHERWNREIEDLLHSGNFGLHIPNDEKHMQDYNTGITTKNDLSATTSHSDDSGLPIQENTKQISDYKSDITIDSGLQIRNDKDSANQREKQDSNDSGLQTRNGKELATRDNRQIRENTYKPASETSEIKPEPPTIEKMEQQTIYISNAGMTLLAPYFPRLFDMLHLTENGKWKTDGLFCEAAQIGNQQAVSSTENDKSSQSSTNGDQVENHDAQIKAMYLLQYLVFEKTDFPEHELVLNKLLTGFETDMPVPRNIELTEEEINTANSLMQSVLQHWSKLKNTSVAGLREAFLQREGKLEEKENSYLLTVEEKAYDMLLDSVPWNFRTIKYSWMEKRIEVRWR